MTEDKVVLGDGDAEHHHDNQDEPQSAPVGLSRRALRFPASRADRKSDRDLGLTVFADHRRLDHEGRGASALGPDTVARDTASFGRSNANVGRFVPVATTGCTLAGSRCLQRKTPRFRTGLFWLTALGFQRLAASRISNLKLKTQKATAPR
ncbi:hypothetical protein [Bradyrhizobium sp. AC87j1]|uniref:hypothetical protein n=1 Tax=Bradyrhizobium sp. AC87j1 TaxID=2055894 RepID=UPI001AEC907C|nr:hypothetical protein [Bradyrhizobium sp. AC87j1]